LVDAVLDNWQSKIAFPSDLPDALRQLAGKVPPGRVDDVMSKQRSKGSPFLPFAHRRTIVCCQKRGWHHDFPIESSVILVLVNDCHLVQGGRGVPPHQGPGAILKMRLSEYHRCQCTTPRSSGKLWIGLSIEAMRSDLGCDRAVLELALRRELDDVCQTLRDRRKIETMRTLP